MASASAATATMAAAGFDKRTSTSSSLQTPGSGVFPSEMMSPTAAASPGLLKRDDLRTPITPPSAYLDFLKNMSPALLSPAPTSAGTRFTFGEKLSDKASSESAIDRSLISPAMSIATSQPTSQPALSRNSSYDSAASSSSSVSTSSVDTTKSAPSASQHSTKALASASRTRPESPRVIIPPSPFAKPGQPGSARTPRRLNLPGSPFSQSQQQPPPSAQSIPSPYATTPASATPWSASFARGDHDQLESMSKPGKVSVRQVVTRTVTYCRTPLDPAPKGKRRKIEVQSAADVDHDDMEEQKRLKGSDGRSSRVGTLPSVISEEDGELERSTSPEVKVEKAEMDTGASAADGVTAMEGVDVGTGKAVKAA